MINSIRKRLNIIKSKLKGDTFIRHSSWKDVAHEIFKHYGPIKKDIKRKLTVEPVNGMLKVEIDGRIIYWPDGADFERLADMYFEVYNENNNHYFDIAETKIKEGDFVIDCGACEGFFTLKALESGAKKVYCIEPGESIVRCLNKTFEDEIQKGKVEVWPYLLGKENKVVRFYENPHDPTVCQIYEKYYDEKDVSPSEGHLKDIEMLTIDEFCKRHSVERVDFIKADVEGSEVDLVSGAIETIKKFRPKLAIAVYHKPNNANLIVEYIDSLALDYKIRVKGIVDFNGIPRPVMVHCF